MLTITLEEIEAGNAFVESTEIPFSENYGKPLVRLGDYTSSSIVGECIGDLAKFAADQLRHQKR